MPAMLPDIPPPVCLQCALSVASQQSGVLDAIGGNVFATAQLQGQDVYAIGTYGSGRFIATSDSSLPFNEVSDCPLTEWLAANGGVQPKVLIFGWGPSDGPGTWNAQADKGGIHLPPQYIGNPAQLAADYDIVMYLEGSGQFGMDQPSDQEIDTLLDFISSGGGSYVSSEFYGYLNNADIVSVNRLLTPLGSPALASNLNWGNVDGNILTSTIHRHSFVVKAKLDRNIPEIETVCDIWRTAEFHEREVYELFGVKFLNHPDLRRLILTDDFEGFPLRKDFEDPVNMIRL